MGLTVDIVKRLGNFRLKAAFQSDGGVLGILGASGCGKSLTLQCIAGIQKPDEGHIELDGVTLFDSARHIDLPPQRRGVGYLFQNCALFPNMTVRQNILCGLRRERGQNRRAALAEAVALLRLEGLENRRPAELSGGQAQRVALARILVSRPRLLLLDEPFSALDAHLRDRIQIEMKELLDSLGWSALLVTHSRDEVYQLCQRMVVLDGGELLAWGETRDLFADPGRWRVSELTGCKNNIPARRAGEHQVFVPDWGITLETARPVRDGLTGVGIRAHSFDPEAAENRFPVTFTGGMEEPFETILEFRYAGQRDPSPPLWWRFPRSKAPAAPPAELGVAPEDVLLLYD